MKNISSNFSTQITFVIVQSLSFFSFQQHQIIPIIWLIHYDD